MKKKRVLIVVILFMIVFCVLPSWNLMPPFLPFQYWQAKAVDVAIHKQLWAQQNITKYKIGVHFRYSLLYYPGGTLGDCSQELIVDHNVVNQIILNTCIEYPPSPAPVEGFLTMDEVFATIEKNDNIQYCPYEGCSCEGPLVMNVVYDAQYQVPKIARTILDRNAKLIFAPIEILSGAGPFYCMGSGIIMTPAPPVLELQIYSFLPLK